MYINWFVYVLEISNPGQMDLSYLLAFVEHKSLRMSTLPSVEQVLLIRLNLLNNPVTYWHKYNVLSGHGIHTGGQHCNG